MKKYRIYRQLGIIIVIFFWVNCSNNSEKSDKKKVVKNKKRSKITKNNIEFNEIFKLSNKIKIENNLNNPIYGIRKIHFSRNYLIVVEQQTNLAYLYSITGQYIKKIGRKGHGPGEYLQASAISFYNNNIYVFDAMQKRLNKFDYKGDYILSEKLSYPGYCLKFNKNGDKYLYNPVTYESKSTVFKYSNKHKLVNQFCPRSRNQFRRGLALGGGIEVDDDDNLYQIHPYEYSLNKFSDNGSQVFSKSHQGVYYHEVQKPNFKNIKGKSLLKLKKEWYSSWTHIGNLLLLNDQYLLVVLINIKTDGLEINLDIFSKNGDFICHVTNLPSNCYYFSSDDKYLYVLKSNNKKITKPLDSGSNQTILQYDLIGEKIK